MEKQKIMKIRILIILYTHTNDLTMRSFNIILVDDIFPQLFHRFFVTYTRAANYHQLNLTSNFIFFSFTQKIIEKRFII